MTKQTKQDNLELFDEALAKLNYDERRNFYNYFIGVASVLVNEAIWKEAVESAALAFAKDHSSQEVIPNPNGLEDEV